MALADYAIVSLAEAKRQLAISQSDTTDDTELEGFIDQVSAWVEDYTGRKVVVQSVSSEIHNGDGTAFLYPDFFPVTQLSVQATPTDAQKLAALQYRDSPDGLWTDIETDIDHVFVDVRNPFIELYDTAFPIGQRNVTISYKAGFTGVPLNEIKRIVLEMVQIAWNEHRGGQNSLGMQNTSDSGGTNMSRSWKDLRPQWKEILDRFRVRRF